MSAHLAVLGALLDGARAEALAALTPDVASALADLRAEGWTVEADADGILGAYGEDVALGPSALALWSERLGLPHAIGYVAQTASTNADLRAAADRGAPHGTALVAGRQTAGRGRRGRAWSHTPGSLALSIVLRPGVAPAQTPLLGLAAAVGVAEACGADVRIKWPNDVLSPSGRKLAGLLAEADLAAGWFVLGIGINANRTPVDQPLAACLRDVDGDPRPLAELAARVVRGVLDHTALAAASPRDALDRWRARSATLGARVRIGDREGVAVDVDASGALLVRDDRGAVATVHAGDVEMVRDVHGRAR